MTSFGETIPENEQLGSISSTFYMCLLRRYFGTKNFKPKTQLCNFWHQNIGAKCVDEIDTRFTLVLLAYVIEQACQTGGPPQPSKSLYDLKIH